MRKLKIGILGTRGIPNNYGGFEQIAGHLAKGLVDKGHSVVVYNTHNHPFKKKRWNGVRIVHIFDPGRWIGTAGQFFYDLISIIDSRRRGYDIILMLGYTSSSIWGRLYSKQSIVLINMDGLEWKRSKYSALVKWFLSVAEKWAIKYATAHIADSRVIKAYLDQKYGINSIYIPYGASLNEMMDESIFKRLGLTKGEYYLLVARIEPENNIDMVLKGLMHSNSNNKFIVVGDTENGFGKKMVEKYGGEQRIVFIGSLYDSGKLFSLISNCSLYFHGHSVGGTNPSLLEAMAAKVLIAAHGNEFNKAILLEDGFYFNNSEEVQAIIEKKYREEIIIEMISNNYQKILNEYNWENVIQRYEEKFLELSTGLSISK